MPSGKMEPGQLHPLKAMSVLCYALDHLRNFLLTTDKINKQKIDVFTSRTNVVFLTFLTRLFKAGGHPELIWTDPSDEFLVTINLKDFLALDNEDELIQKILSFSNRAEGMNLDALVVEENDN